jgi:CRISPR-associated protein (TIGR02584 family)
VREIDQRVADDASGCVTSRHAKPISPVFSTSGKRYSIGKLANAADLNRVPYTEEMHHPKANCDMPIEQPKRRVLLCVTGLSPQIVTETIYALSKAATSPWVPNEVRLVTTQRGADNARLMLLSDFPGWFHRLRTDWKLPPIAFDAEHIEVLHDRNGDPLHDVRDDADNQSAADGIANIVQRLTEDEHSEIHASIAGGRKTMGFFLGYAMSLWGRQQDRLSHVLVSSPFESRPEFYYPTPSPYVIPASAPGQDPLDASKAKVWLGDIPFVRLRSLLPASLTNQNAGFAQAVAAANQALDAIELEIDIAQSCVRINQHAIALPPMQLGLLCLLAWRCQQQLAPLPAPSKEADDADWKYLALQALKLAMGELHIPHSLYQRLNDQQPLGDTFSQQLSKLEKTLRNSGTLPLSGLIARENIGIRSRQQGYRLNLQPHRVRILQAC